MDGIALARLDLLVFGLRSVDLRWKGQCASEFIRINSNPTLLIYRLIWLSENHLD